MRAGVVHLGSPWHKGIDAQSLTDELERLLSRSFLVKRSGTQIDFETKPNLAWMGSNLDLPLFQLADLWVSSLVATVRSGHLNLEDGDGGVLVQYAIDERRWPLWLGASLLLAALVLVTASSAAWDALAIGVALAFAGVAMIVRQGFVLGAIGIALGIPGVLGVNRLIQSIMADFVPVELSVVPR